LWWITSIRNPFSIIKYSFSLSIEMDNNVTSMKM
jgi:hypothetical protein